MCESGKVGFSKKLIVKGAGLHTLLFCILLFQGYSQSFSKEETLQDLNFLQESIKIYNPGLYNFNPDFDEKADSLLATIGSDLNKFQYFTKVSQLCALSNEGHFNVGSWEDTVHNGFLTNRYKYLPIEVKMVDMRVFVCNNYSNDTSIKRGDEIVAINGAKTMDVVAHIYTCLSGDGNIKSYLREKLTGNFNWMYYLYVDQPKSFELQMSRDPNYGKKELKTIEALNRQEIVENFRKVTKEEEQGITQEKGGALYDLHFEDSLAFLSLKTFDWKVVEEGNYKAKKLYKTIFKEIQTNGASVLVVDLRGNTGGRNEFAMKMIPYINKEGEKGAIYKTSISWEGKRKEYKLPKKSKYAFEGRVFSLTDGYTYSAGAALARYLREYAGAFSVGSETGTRYEGFAAGSKQAVFLPNTNIKIGIPRYVFIYPDSKKRTLPNRGLLPDFPTYPTMGTYIEEIDLEMQKVRNVIKDCGACHL